MRRQVMRMILAAAVLLALVPPAASKAARPAPYRLHALRGDAFPALTILESEFGGDYRRVAFVPVAESDQVAETLIDTIPAPPPQELTFQSNATTPHYLPFPHLSNP